MIQKTLICLSYLFVLTFGYDSQRRLTYNQADSISNSDDTLVRASNLLVGFWFKNTNVFWIHKKTSYLKGITSDAICYYK